MENNTTLDLEIEELDATVAPFAAGARPSEGPQRLLADVVFDSLGVGLRDKGRHA